MPTSFWGFLTYALLAAIAWNRYADSQWKFAWFVTVIGLLYSLYLTGVSFFVLQAACPYCLTSLGLMTAIFVTLLFQKPANLPRFSWGPWLGKSVGTALIIVAMLHLHYAGYLGKAPGPEDPWIRGLAEHLTRTNAKFYGASWCPHCAEQKELFGSSARRLPYIECSSAGPGSRQTALCNDAGIKSYPTWVINGQRYIGTQTLDALAQYSNYKSNDGAKP
jgi:glutaredoxin